MNKLLLVAAAGLSIAALSSPASAADGTVTITGTVSTVTCSINAGTPNIAVTLPTVPTTSLKVSGDTAGSQTFNIALTGCGALTKATGYFEPGANTDFTTGNLKNNGTASNVQVRVLNADLTPITMGASLATQGSKQITLASGAGNLGYVAQYIATGLGGAGTVTTNVQYTVVYQ
ncbi:MAG TPA: fimbrial protein [Lysobacter sp.]